MEIRPPAQVLSTRFMLEHHTCENFLLSPLQPKPKRIGPHHSCGSRMHPLLYLGTTGALMFFVQTDANQAAGKYDNVSTNNQFEFYKREGLTPYSPVNLPITRDVPECCVIIREHTPMTNLFTCLWFNEVDRFTSRDQLSFSIVRDKIMSKVNWTMNMFLDCERRNFVVQAFHRDLLEWKPLASSHPPLPLLMNERPEQTVASFVLKVTRPPLTRKRGRDRKSSSRYRHPRTTSGRDSF